MKIDTHLHAEYSLDSTINSEELIQKAINHNYEYICFTEHFDLLPQEIAKYGVLPVLRYQEKIESLREKYPQIRIGFGLEMGEMHRTKEVRDVIFKDISLDYIIGSIHLLRNGINLSTPIDFSLQESDIMLYYLEVVEMINMGGFDTLGHLDIYRREISEDNLKSIHFQDIVDTILRSIIEKNICLEINYSGFRSSCNSTLPDESVIKRFIELGGELITIGSDSHRIEFFDKYYDRTVDLLKNNAVKYVFYKYNNEWISKKI